MTTILAFHPPSPTKCPMNKNADFLAALLYIPTFRTVAMYGQHGLPPSPLRRRFPGCPHPSCLSTARREQDMHDEYHIPTHAVDLQPYRCACCKITIAPQPPSLFLQMQRDLSEEEAGRPKYLIVPTARRRLDSQTCQMVFSQPLRDIALQTMNQ